MDEMATSEAGFIDQLLGLKGVINFSSFAPYVKYTIHPVFIITCFIIYIVVYRLFLHPIADIPGPWLASITHSYEFYYDYIRKGSYIYQIEAMHHRYGPIVRINPTEVSIRDHEFYSQVYVSGSTRRTENCSHFGTGIGFEDSHFLSTTHELHRRRRKPLEPFFSRMGLQRVQPVIQTLAEKLSKRLEAVKGSDEIIRLDHAFLALSGDTIARICCNSPQHLLDEPDFGEPFFNLLHDIIKSVPLFMGMPWIINIVSLIPSWLSSMFMPKSQVFDTFRKLCIAHINEAKQSRKNSTNQTSTNDNHPETATKSLFQQLLSDGTMPDSELETERLNKEAQVLLAAGSVSTARTLDFISFYILANPSIKQRLQEDLREVMADYPDKMPSWATLETVPYLNALIKEGLRLSYGVMHRLPRVSPDTSISYGKYNIPPGTPIGMSAYFMHTQPDVFPDPFKFDPQRWLNNKEKHSEMDKCLVPFSKGSRQCLGMNLAYAELYIALAIIFRPQAQYSIQLHETDESDIVQKHDFLIPLPRLESKGFRVKVV